MILSWFLLALAIFGLYLMLIWVSILQNDKLKVEKDIENSEQRNKWYAEELEKQLGIIEQIEKELGAEK